MATTSLVKWLGQTVTGLEETTLTQVRPSAWLCTGLSWVNEALYDICFRASKLTLPTLWQAEAAKRGLPNFKVSVQAVDHLTDAKNVELLKR